MFVILEVRGIMTLPPEHWKLWELTGVRDSPVPKWDKTVSFTPSSRFLPTGSRLVMRFAILLR